MELKTNAALPKWVFIILFSITSLVMIGSAFDFPTNGDEIEHIANGKANVKFYTSLGKDTSYLNPPHPYRTKDMSLMRYYGVFTDVTAEVFCAPLTKMGMDYMDARHIWNVLLCLLGVLFTSLTARLFTRSWWAASLALLILMATPPFTGFAYNLTKDIPLATGFIVALYAVYAIFLRITEPLNKKLLGLLALGVCIAIGNRVGGILIYMYTGLFLCIAAYRHRKELPAGDLKKKVLWVCGTLLAGHVAGLFFWPYGLVSPIGHFKETMDALTKYPLQMTTMMDGINMDINDAFWYFIPKYMLITTPLVFLAGLVLSVLALFYKPVAGKQYRTAFLLLLFPGIFPILYEIYQKAVVLQCWRHFLFVYPPLVALAAIGWYYLLNHPKRIYLGIVFLLLFLKPVVWMVQNHPYEYTYFNELIGGPEGANNNYEFDSYCFGIKNCMKWIATHNDIRKDTLVINCNDDDPPIYYAQKYLKQPVKNIIGGFRTRNAREWDYGIYSTLFLTKEEREKFFPPENYELVHAEYINKDIPVYIVLKRRGDLDYQGIQAFEHRNFPLADSLLSLYNKRSDYYANATTTYELLTKINMQRYAEAVALYNLLSSKNRTTLDMDYYGAVALANSGQLQQARNVLQNAIENGLEDPNAAKTLQQINQQLNMGGQRAF